MAFIDFHIHTKKTAQGDPKTRNISNEELVEKISSKNIKFAAITNHNHIDFKNTKSINDLMELNNVDCKVFFGVELDVLFKGNSRHLNVVFDSDSDLVKDYFDEYFENYKKSNLKKEWLDIADDLKGIKKIIVLDCKNSDKSFSDKEIIDLIDKQVHNTAYMYEVNNESKKIIFTKHGLLPIQFSDNRSIDDLGDTLLPELKIEVNSFEGLYNLIIQKKELIINELKSIKTYTFSVIVEKEEEGAVDIPIKKGLNILIGNKGTGKTKILEWFFKNYTLQQKYVFNDKYELEEHNKKVEELPAHFWNDEMKLVDMLLKKLEKIDLNIANYFVDHYNYFSTNVKNKAVSTNSFSDLNIACKPIREPFKVGNDLNIASIKKGLVRYNDNLSIENNESFNKVIKHIDIYNKENRDKFLMANRESVANNISCAISNASKVTWEKHRGTPINKGELGLYKYFVSKMEANKIVKELKRVIDLEERIERVPIGEVPNKGEIFLTLKSKFVSTNDVNSPYKKHTKTTKPILKEFIKLLKKVNSEYSYKDLCDLVKVIMNNKIKSLDMLTSRIHKEIKGKEYTPSKGEKSILNINDFLNRHKGLLLFDEPDEGLGNEYINNNFISMIKKCSEDNTIIIITHNANLAIRSWPINMIFREYNESGDYLTYIGNPYTNTMTELRTNEQRSWKEIVVENLEGGIEAFSERGNVYGINYKL